MTTRIFNYLIQSNKNSFETIFFFFSCMYLQFMSLKNFNFTRTDVLKLIKLILPLMFTLGSEVIFSVN